MARIQWRDAVVYFEDGLAGTAAVNDMMVAAADTTITIDTVALNTDITTKVPIGARFTIDGETVPQTHSVTGTSVGDSTTEITFTPALGAGTYVDNAVITFLPQRIEIKTGEGTMEYTETSEYEYLRNRGRLDTVVEGDEQPMSVSLEMVYEAIASSSGEAITPMEALKRRGPASAWVSSATDKCEPYAIDVVVIHTPNCGTKQSEKVVFPDFRSDSRNVSFTDATISVTGQCNAVEPIITRAASFN